MSEREQTATSDPGDPFTMSMKLCDDDGIVRSGSMHHGTDYPCTGHAHTMGEHIYCTSPAHQRDVREMEPRFDDLPKDLQRVLEDPGIVIERDGLVWALIGRHTLDV